jgi:putative transposase
MKKGLQPRVLLYAPTMPLPAPQELRPYFVTAVTANRRRLFQVDANAALLLETLFSYRDQGRFELHAFVVMPDHVHVMMTPAPDVSLEKAVQFIKGGFSFRLKSRLDVWSRSFNESQILSLEKFEACRAYIEQNPIRAGLCESADSFSYGSAHRKDMVEPRPLHLR